MDAENFIGTYKVEQIKKRALKKFEFIKDVLAIVGAVSLFLEALILIRIV